MGSRCLGRQVNEAVAVVLELATKHSDVAYNGVLAGCDAVDDNAAAALLDAFAASYFRERIGIAARSHMTLKRGISAIRASLRLSSISSLSKLALKRSVSESDADELPHLASPPSLHTAESDPLSLQSLSLKARADSSASLLSAHARLDSATLSPGRSLAARRFAAAARASRMAVRMRDSSPTMIYAGPDSSPASIGRSERLAALREAARGMQPSGTEAPAAADPEEEARRNERIITSLSRLFVGKPARTQL